MKKPRRVKVKTESMLRLSKETLRRDEQEYRLELQALADLEARYGKAAPRQGACPLVTRVAELPSGEVIDFRGPEGFVRCPWVHCRYHLYLEVVNKGRSLRIVFPDQEPTELAKPCLLQVLQGGAMLLSEIGEVQNLTRERTRQVVKKCLTALRRNPEVVTSPEDWTEGCTLERMDELDKETR